MNIKTILILAVFARLLLSPFGSHPIDVPDWIGWSNRLTQVPFRQFYDAWSDYLPGYLYVLWILGLAKNFLITAGITLKEDVIYKLPAIAADAATGYLIFVIAKKYFSQKRALIFTSLYLFNPAIFYNSSLWGQTDSVTAFFSLLALYLIFEGKLLLSSLSFSYSYLAKPVGLLISPLIGVVLLKKDGLVNTLKFGLLAGAVTILAFAPFANKINIFQFILERLNVTFGQYPYTSLTSFNLWYLLADFWQTDNQTFLGVTYQSWGFAIFGLFTLFGIFLLLKNWSENDKKNFEWALICGILIYAAGFLFLTRVHERQLHSAITFLALASIFRPQFLIYYAIFSITYILDLRFAFVWVAENFRYIFSRNTVILISLVNLLTFSIFLGTILPQRFFKNEKVKR